MDKISIYQKGLELMLTLELFNKEKHNDPGLYDDLPTFILPGFGLTIFYRIY
jgi:hypothetical protein